jgi:serine/threonine protein kinase
LQPGLDKASQSGPFGRQDPSLPQVFGRYLLIQRLSRGGMGEIFLAKHGLAGFEKLAVIKKVLPHLAADESFISRFVDEAQVAIKLQHVNVAQVFEVGRVGDEYFLALEYVEGRDLRRTLSLLGHRKQRLPVDLALFIGRELANGLAYAHRRTSLDGASLNLVHCDISPPNVLVSFEGETKVIDFGIAKSALRGTATDPKMGFGKFGYMAPEQLIRGGIVDHRTDIYAASVVLYEVLTGQRLYEAGPEPDYRALAKKVARGEHTLPSEIDPMLAPYDDLVATGLRPKVEDRYQTAAELRDAIQQALVQVNPTISTDQLGSYMRDLFNDEMTAQKELHDRIANVHLSDFQQDFHTQTISTVSFAVATGQALPLGEGRRSKQQTAVPPPRPSGSQPAQRSSGSQPSQRCASGPQPAILDTQAPPTSSMSADDLAALSSLADGTGTAEKTVMSFTELPASRDRTRLYLILAGLLLATVVIVVILLQRDGSEPPKVADNPPPVVKKQDAITVDPIEPKAGSNTKPVEPPPIEMPIDKVVQKPRDKPRDRPKQPAEVKVGSGSGAPEKPEKPAVTADQVTNKFLAAKRLYTAYKDKNGGRLDADFNDLMVFLQLDHPQAERLRRIDVFVSKIPRE